MKPWLSTPDAGNGAFFVQTGMKAQKHLLIHRNLMAFSAAAAILFTGVLPIHAEENELKAKSRDVVVTASRKTEAYKDAPASISVVDAETMERGGIKSIADALEDVPGVEVYDQSVPGAKKVTIRGESGSRVLIMVDGQKITEQKSMDGAAILVRPELVERIEVVKGPASVLYGSEAIGGVVNIITKKSGKKAIEVEASISFDSSTGGSDTFASVSGRNGNLGYRASGVMADHGDRETAEGTLENSDYRTKSGSAYLDWTWDKGSVSYSYDNYWSDINSHTPEGTTGPVMKYFQLDLPEWRREKHAVFAEVKDVTSHITKISGNAYYQDTFKEFHNDMNLLIPMGPTGKMTQELRQKTENDQNTIGANLQADWYLPGNNYVITGLDSTFDSLDSTLDVKTVTITPMPPPNGTRKEKLASYDYEGSLDTFAFYLQDEMRIGSVSLTAGLRQTWIDSGLDKTNNPSIQTRDENDSHPVFSAGISWSGIKDLTLRGLFAQGYRYANLQQLYIGTVHGGQTPTLPNPDLDPETSDNFEVGARYDRNGFYLDLAGFMSKADDYITTASVENGAANQYVNADKAETWGVEIGTGARIRETGFTPYASATFIQRHFESGGKGTWDTGEPPFQGKLGLKWEKTSLMAGTDLHTDLFARFATEAKKESPDGSTESWHSWETLNLTVGSDFGKDKEYSLDLGIHNIFDRSYVMASSSLPEAGRCATVRFGCKF